MTEMNQIKIFRSNSLDKIENTANKFLEDHKDIILDSVKIEFTQVEKPTLMYVMVMTYKLMK